MAPTTMKPGAPTTVAPEVVPQPAPQMTPKNSIAGKVVLGVVVLLLGFGAYKIIMGSHAPETPEGVVSRMMQTMENVTSGEFVASVEGNVQSSKNPIASLEAFGQPVGDESEESSENKPLVFTLGVSGSADMTDEQKIKSNVKITVASPDFPGGQSAEIEFRTIEGNNFFKLNKIPTIGTLNLSSLAGSWVDLDTDALKEQFGASTTTEPVFPTSTLSDEKKDRIKNIVTSAKLFQVAGDAGDTDVGGVAVYHYKVTLNEAEVIRVTREVYEISQGKSMTSEEEKEMAEMWASTEVTNGEIWIGKKDFHLYGVSFDLKMEKVGEDESSGTLAVDLQLRNLNKPVVIETPEGTKSIMDFVGQVFGIIMTQSLGSAFSEDGMVPQP